MKLTKQEVQNVANLARLELSEKELKTYGKQLSDILTYVDQLKEVDTSGVALGLSVNNLENAWREDKVKDWNEEERDIALKQAKISENGEIKVNKVL